MLSFLGFLGSGSDEVMKLSGSLGRPIFLSASLVARLENILVSTVAAWLWLYSTLFVGSLPLLFNGLETKIPSLELIRWLAGWTRNGALILSYFSHKK